MIPSHILLVDDEPALTRVLEPILKAEGHQVTLAATGQAAILAARDTAPDIILLDLGLPDIDGKDVIRAIRAESDVPIIVISARHQELEKISALDDGADDYVNKPFELGELFARMRAASRRSRARQAEQSVIDCGTLSIDLRRRQVRLADEVVRLSPKEYALLQTLALSLGQVVTHKRLLQAGWDNAASDTSHLRVYIGLLRQKLEQDPADPKFLLSEPGVGYRLVPDN
jgi:two-component system KDP operon response regulator KdpE